MIGSLLGSNFISFLSFALSSASATWFDPIRSLQDQCETCTGHVSAIGSVLLVLFILGCIVGYYVAPSRPQTVGSWKLRGSETWSNQPCEDHSWTGHPKIKRRGGCKNPFCARSGSKAHLLPGRLSQSMDVTGMSREHRPSSAALAVLALLCHGGTGGVWGWREKEGTVSGGQTFAVLVTRDTCEQHHIKGLDLRNAVYPDVQTQRTKSRNILPHIASHMLSIQFPACCFCFPHWMFLLR